MQKYMEDLVSTIEAAKAPPVVEAVVRDQRRPKIGRNEPCPCGSGKKHKKCCGGALAPELTFSFMDARDKVGLPMEHESYVNQKCTDCNGNGYIRLLIGETREATPRACFCVNKGYVRVRKEFERQWAEIMKSKSPPKTEAEEWAERVGLVIRMGFTRPPVPTPTLPAPQDV